jgi:hypothetical protein
MRRIAFFLACTLALFASALTAQAQEPADVLKVDYFVNANTSGAPDGTVRLTNPGTAGGNICASIFVFDTAQELTECCGCLLTPDGLRTLSINTDLTSNPLTGITITAGTIEIVSSAAGDGVCPLPTSMQPVAGLRAWTTHIQSVGSSTTPAVASFAITETAAQNATMSARELGLLDSFCTGIKISSGAHGVCSCGTGD